MLAVRHVFYIDHVEVKSLVEGARPEACQVKRDMFISCSLDLSFNLGEVLEHLRKF